MAAPSAVFTLAYVAKKLRVDVEVIEELSADMEPEDGRLWVVDSLDENAPDVIAFTSDGIDYLNELLDDRRSQFMSNT